MKENYNPKTGYYHFHADSEKFKKLLGRIAYPDKGTTFSDGGVVYEVGLQHRAFPHTHESIPEISYAYNIQVEIISHTSDEQKNT